MARSQEQIEEEDKEPPEPPAAPLAIFGGICDSTERPSVEATPFDVNVNADS